MVSETMVQSELPAIILLGKTAISAAELQEVARYAEQLRASGRGATVRHAFAEQGSPNLRSVVHDLCDEGYRHVLILPLFVPMEPSLPAWITRALQRWQAETNGDWPSFRIGRGPADCPQMPALLDAMLDSALAADPVTAKPDIDNGGSVLIARKYRVLVCRGRSCNLRGAGLAWGYLRNTQTRRKLMGRGEGMRSTATGCLGPCNLAPVVQVYPEGTFYGGVDTHGMDRIIDEHLLNGRVVEDLAYAPGPGKQRLRRPKEQRQDPG